MDEPQPEPDWWQADSGPRQGVKSYATYAGWKKYNPGGEEAQVESRPDEDEDCEGQLPCQGNLAPKCCRSMCERVCDRERPWLSKRLLYKPGGYWGVVRQNSVGGQATEPATGTLVKTVGVMEGALRSPVVSVAIWAAILGATALAGVQTYDPENPSFKDAVDLAEAVVLAIFVVELLLRWAVAGAFRYFLSLWHILDFTIVMVCLLPLDKGGENTDFVMAMRLLRLLRVLKLVKKVKALQMIMSSMTEGGKAVFSIGGLMFLVLYVSGVIAVMLFRENDPVHFRSLHVAMLSLFRMATLEDWTDIMYVAMHGCAKTNYQYSTSTYGIHNIHICKHSGDGGSTGGIAVVFFVFFIMIVGFIFISSFVGVITDGMSTGIDKIKERDLWQRRKHRKKRQQEHKRIYELNKTHKSNRSLRTKSAKGGCSLADEAREEVQYCWRNFKQGVRLWFDIAEYRQSRRAMLHKRFSRQTETTLWVSGFAVALACDQVALERLLALGGDVVSTTVRVKPRKNTETGRDHLYKSWALANFSNSDALARLEQAAPVTVPPDAKDTDGNPQLKFKAADVTGELKRKRADGSMGTLAKNAENYMTLTACGKMINFSHGAAYDKEEDGGDETYSGVNKVVQGTVIIAILMSAILAGIEVEDPSNDVVAVGEVVILLIFILELLLKVVAEGSRPWNYLRRKGNIFDMGIVIVCTVSLCLGEEDGAGNGSVFAMLRMFRALRLVRLLDRVEGLSMIVSGLHDGLVSILFVGLILVITFYVFAVAAVIFFRANDPFHFLNLHTAWLSLFRVATGEDWTDVMYISVYGCDQWGYESPLPYPDMFDSRPGATVSCTDSREGGFLAVVYWILFYVALAFIVLNLFVGVVTVGMEASLRAARERNRDKFSAVRLAFPEVTDGCIQEMEQVFSEIDTTNRGSVTRAELDEYNSSRPEFALSHSQNRVLNRLSSNNGNKDPGQELYLFDLIAESVGDPAIRDGIARYQERGEMPPPDRFVKKPCKEDGDTDFNQGVADAGEHLPLSTMVVVAKVLLKLQRHYRHKVATKNGTSMEAEAEAGAEINWAEGAKKTIVTALVLGHHYRHKDAATKTEVESEAGAENHLAIVP